MLWSLEHYRSNCVRVRVLLQNLQNSNPPCTSNTVDPTDVHIAPMSLYKSDSFSPAFSLHHTRLFCLAIFAEGVEFLTAL
jgi:hypothetical protein